MKSNVTVFEDEVSEEEDSSCRPLGNFDEGNDEEFKSYVSFYCSNETGDTKSPVSTIESYLKMHFMWVGNSSLPIPLYIVCGKQLSNTLIFPPNSQPFDK